MLAKDYLKRNLANATPGTTNAKDYLGRDIQAGNLDHLGRQLSA
jgi:hypothetical protein